LPIHPIQGSGEDVSVRCTENENTELGERAASQDALVVDDLVEIKAGGAVKPRPPTATSVPGLLALFHNEWDATMLETHALREQVGSHHPPSPR
jgi:pre-mRNA-processing factor 19